MYTMIQFVVWRCCEIQTLLGWVWLFPVHSSTTTVKKHQTDNMSTCLQFNGIHRLRSYHGMQFYFWHEKKPDSTINSWPLLFVLCNSDCIWSIGWFGVEWRAWWIRDYINNNNSSCRLFEFCLIFNICLAAHTLQQYVRHTHLSILFRLIRFLSNNNFDKHPSVVFINTCNVAIRQIDSYGLSGKPTVYGVWLKL